MTADTKWIRQIFHRATLSMLLMERIGNCKIAFLSWPSDYPPLATCSSDLCADLWVRAKLLAPVAEELGLFTRSSVKSKKSGTRRIETLV